MPPKTGAAARYTGDSREDWFPGYWTLRGTGLGGRNQCHGRFYFPQPLNQWGHVSREKNTAVHERSHRKAFEGCPYRRMVRVVDTSKGERASVPLKLHGRTETVEPGDGSFSPPVFGRVPESRRVMRKADLLQPPRGRGVVEQALTSMIGCKEGRTTFRAGPRSSDPVIQPLGSNVGSLFRIERHSKGSIEFVAFWYYNRHRIQFRAGGVFISRRCAV